MGNKLNCSCAPPFRKPYRYEDSPWQTARRRDGHLLRLWAEVFHVSAGGGAVKWQQVSEDLVPVNITCVQDSPDCVFHITAYNSQVDKILDVRLAQPGTRLGQASECFVYWKDPVTGDTWGLNFTSPIDAKQFRECCSPSFKFSRKASSSYSLKLEPPKQQKTKGGRRKPQSTPSSPSRGRELQCTCMTAESLHRARNGRVRYTGAATLPRARAADDSRVAYGRGTDAPRPAVRTSLQDRISDAAAPTQGPEQARQLYASRKEQAKSVDCSLSRDRAVRHEELMPQSRTKSKSTDNVFEQAQVGDVPGLSLDSDTLKRMLHPLPPEEEAPPERKRLLRKLNSDDSRDLSRAFSAANRSRQHRSETGRRRSLERTTCLDLTDSPPSEQWGRECYATSSSNSEEGPPRPPTPTGRLLLEYETHLRNALARGLDAESYSLRTFEALLSQSMENVVALMREVHAELEAIRQEERNISSLDGMNFDRRPAGSSPAGPRLTSAGSSFESSIAQQPSVESADSRIYLTSSEMSDDDRLSLTTALSEEEDGDARNSPFRARSGSAAAAFHCTGAVRKAGFLSVKKWLLRKRQRVEVARKRGWKSYWVCLKGTTLLFYPCDERDADGTPKHLIIVDGAVLQPIPEHPKRDHVFCLSTAFGDAYLFQAPSHVELEKWVDAIHCACAAAFARHRGKTGTLHLLQEEIFRFDRDVESDSKLRHMAELQLTVVADEESREALSAQVERWDESVERLRCEQFRLRCYMASLQAGELPNPKSLLANVSKASKGTLNQLGVFTVSSFHAYICARSPSLLTNLLAGRGATKRRSLSRSNSGRRSLSLSTTSSCSLDIPSGPEITIKVQVPDNQTISLNVREQATVEEVLWSACAKRQLSPGDHFLRVRRRRDSEEYCVPPRTDTIGAVANQSEVLEVCAKVLYQVELCRHSPETLFGFSVEAELVENVEHQDELCVFVSRVEEGSLAHLQGLMAGDELMVINGAIVSDLDMMFIEGVLQEEQSLCMMMRSCRAEPPELALRAPPHDYIEALVCPPPPPRDDDRLWPPGRTPVKAGSTEKSPDTSGRPSPAPSNDALSVDQIDSILKVIEDSCKKTADTVTEYCRAPPERRSSSASGGTRPLSDAEKLRKVIGELIDTERTYVKHMSDLLEWYVDALTKHLNSLLEHYLEPMKKETFLSHAEVQALFGNIQEIVQFQRVFLQSLEEAVAAEPRFHTLEQPPQFKNVLFALGNSFLYYADQFKLYSSFCASHSKAQKVLHPGEGNAALVEFLASRNPRGQHSFSLESHLIKPIQRILKYPLLLQQLKHITDPASEEHHHLAEALKGMERVAEHINEMQRIHEEYGAIFDHLHRQHLKSSKQHVDLSPGELLFYAGVDWLNISEFLGKIKKGLELYAMCFVFKTAVVFLCKEKIRQKKKLMGSSNKNSTSEVEIIRYQVLIPVTEVQVRSSTQKDGETHFFWELIHLKSQLQRRSEKVYQLSNGTSELRNSFLRTIRQIIRESVRNMTVPAAKARDKSPKPRSDGLARTLSNKRRSRHTQRHSAGAFDSADEQRRGASRSRTVADDLSGSARDLRSPAQDGVRALSLSAASSLSGSSARLIQSSQPPGSYQPQAAAQASSPVWKPRGELDKAATLPKEAAGKQYFVYDEYGAPLYVIPPTLPKREASKQSDC